jgi:transcriptional regulator with AAA-type ATPase domain
VLDGGELARRTSWRQEAADALASGGAVVLRRLEDVDTSQIGAVKAVADMLASAGRAPDGPAARLVVTADLTRSSEDVHRLLSQVAVGIDLPALASRTAEIPSLVRAVTAGIEPRRRPVLSAATMQVLMRWDWPGNVAELRHVLLGLAAELPGQSVSPYHLPDRMWDAANRRTLTRFQSAERSEILAALRQSGGNRSRAASLLGIGRTTLYRKLHALGIEDEALLS